MNNKFDGFSHKNQNILRVSKGISKRNSLELDDDLITIFSTTHGCYTEEAGVVCNIIDMEDTENLEFLSQDPNNVIFLISPSNNNKYYAYGYNKKKLAYDINSEIYYDCKRNLDGSYITSQDGKTAFFDNNSVAYVKLNLIFPVLVLATEMLDLINDNKQIFILKEPKKKFLYTTSYGSMFNSNPNYVSSDHCQKGSSKMVYTLYVLEKNL
jgi:hypothetical protein